MLSPKATNSWSLAKMECTNRKAAVLIDGKGGSVLDAAEIVGGAVFLAKSRPNGFLPNVEQVHPAVRIISELLLIAGVCFFSGLTRIPYNDPEPHTKTSAKE